MPDFQAFSVTPLAPANVNTHRFTVSCLVLDSQTGTLLADLTGSNAIQWPAVLTTLTAAQRQELIEMVVWRLLQMKAGLV